MLSIKLNCILFRKRCQVYEIASWMIFSSGEQLKEHGGMANGRQLRSLRSEAQGGISTTLHLCVAECASPCSLLRIHIHV